MGMAWHDEVDRVFRQDSMESGLMFQEDRRMFSPEIECIERRTESSALLCRMIGHTSESDTVEVDTLIIEYSYLRIPEGPEYRLTVCILLMIPIREEDPVWRTDMIELAYDRRIVWHRPIEKISWYDHDLPSECIDLFDEPSCWLGVMDITIVHIGDHDDFFPMPGVRLREGYLIFSYMRHVARIESINIHTYWEDEEYREMSDMRIGDAPDERMYQSKYRYSARDRDGTEPDRSDRIDAIDISMLVKHREYRPYDEECRSSEWYADPEERKRFEKWEESEDDRGHPICPRVDDTREYEKKEKECDHAEGSW